MLAPGLKDKLTMNLAEVVNAAQSRVPGYDEFLGAAMGDAFDRTTTANFMLEQKVRGGEQDAYGNSAYGETSGGGSEIDMMTGGFGLTSSTPVQRVQYISKEDWNENNEFYREGIAWREDLTPVRASIYAEEYDKRKMREYILGLGKEHYGFMKGSVPAFIAGALGSLPDPVNFIPFTGWGASVGLKQGLRRGIIEGVAGNAVADALVFPYMNERGADLGFADLTMDLAFGALIGGAFGGLGGWRAGRREARLKEVQDRILEVSQPQAEQSAQNLVDGQQADITPDARAVAEGLRGRNQARDLARVVTTRDGRQQVLNAHTLAVDDIADGRAVDVADTLRESEALSNLYDHVLFNPEFSADPYNPQVRLAYSRLADELGVNLGDVFVDSGSGVRMGNGSVKVKSNLGMIKFIWKHGEKSEKAFQVTKEDIVAFPRVLREYMPHFQEKQQSYAWVVRREDGELVRYTVRRFKEDGVSHLVTVHVLEDKAAYTQSPKIKTAPSASSGRLSWSAGDTAVEPFGRLPRGQEGTVHQIGDLNISAGGKTVNHFARPEPETFTPMAERITQFEAERAAKLEAAQRDMGIDSTGRTIEEHQAADLIEQGRARPEDIEAVAEAGRQEARVNELEEAGLNVAECVMEVLE